MRTYLGTVVVCCLLLSGCVEQGASTRQGDARFTERIAGCAESVDGIIYVIGGVNETQQPNTYLSIVEAYDPSTDTWTTKPDMPTARWILSTSVVDGTIYAMGGTGTVDYVNDALSTVEAYNPAHDPGSDVSIEALFWGALKAMFR